MGGLPAGSNVMTRTDGRPTSARQPPFRPAYGFSMRRFLSRVLQLGVVVGAGYVLWRVLTSRAPGARGADVHIPSQLTPPGGPETSVVGATWVEPVEGACPSSHPVKASLASGAFHVPGEPEYERTVPDRCYLDAATASADGLRSTAN